MDLPQVPKEASWPLPCGCTLYMTTDKHGMRHYTSDEVDVGVFVWSPALVYASTLLTAIVEEERITRLECERARRAKETPDA